MCFRDVLQILRSDGFDISITQLRWAIDSEKISPPPRDGSNRFDFGTQHVDELRQYFQGRQGKRRSCA